MSGNENELPEGESSRLRDRATSELQRRRDQTEQAASRLANRATTTFQRRRRQAQQFREQLGEQRDRFANALDLDPGAIEPVQLDRRGEEIGFVPDSSGRSQLAEQFASDRPFVDPDDALVDADPRAGVEARVDPAATDEVASEARQQTAAEDPFAEPGDLDANVGPGGVEAIDFTEQGARRRAGRELESETALGSVDPADDLQTTDSEFGLTQPAQRRAATREFESDIDVFGSGELDPATDVQSTDSGFGLARDPAREAAAADIDQQLPSVDVGPGDVELEATDGGGFEATFETEVER